MRYTMRMKTRHTVQAAVFFLILQILFSCSTVKKAENPLSFDAAPLFGMACDTEGDPVAALSIVIDGVPAAESDINGRFIVPSLVKGGHRIEALSEGYETIALDFQFLNRTQVLYLRLNSRTSLTKLLEDALDTDRLDEADAALVRLKAVSDTDDPVVLFFSAIVAGRRAEPGRAAGLLQRLIELGYDTKEVREFLMKEEKKI